MRCKYCHNPDTWQMQGGKEVSVSELMAMYESCASFYHAGGITASGGEPLGQLPFLIELFGEAKKRNIHTCLDTSGILYKSDDPLYEQLLDLTDLVMLDIKHIDQAAHRELTGCANDAVLVFARAVADKGIPIWIRHVVVPGITLHKPSLVRLGQFIATLKSLKAIDVLPYHDMGKEKYRQMAMEYPLADTPPASKEEAETAKKWIMQGMREALKK